MDDPPTSESGRPASGDSSCLRWYIVRIAKVHLCVSGWFAITATLLMYGPPAMSVPIRSGPSHDNGIVAAIFGMVLSAGAATVLTIILAVGVLAIIGQIRSIGEQNETDATDGVEDESHV